MLYFFCFILAAFMIFGAPSLMQHQVSKGIEKAIQLTDTNSDGYKQFVDHNDQGINEYYMYVFNITNPDEILDGKLPKVEEIGPFVYKNNQIRSEVKVDKEKDEASFRLHCSTEFLPLETLEKSGQFETDEVAITTFNMIFFGAEAALGHALWFAEFNPYPDRDKMFTTLTVHDILYGYDTTLSGRVVKFPGFLPNFNKTEDPDYTGIHIVSAGIDDQTNYNYKQWRGQTKIKVPCPWVLPPAPPGMFPCYINESPVWQHHIIDFKEHNPNKVGGSTGDQFKPKPDKTVSAWVDTLQREIQLVFNEDAKYKGVPIKRYIIDPIEAMNDKDYPRNWAFYQYGRSGLFNMTMIQLGAPIFASYPHFLDADANLTKRVLGMNPQKDLHQTSIDVEYNTGTTLRERERFQINLQIRPKTFPRLKNEWFPNLAFPDEGQFIPIAWIGKRGDTKDDDISDLKTMETVIKSESWIRYAGIALVCISLIVWIYINWRRPSEDPRLNSTHAGLNYFGNAGTERLVEDGTTAQSDYPVMGSKF